MSQKIATDTKRKRCKELRKKNEKRKMKKEKRKKKKEIISSFPHPICPL
jgi:hypothetical protein